MHFFFFYALRSRGYYFLLIYAFAQIDYCPPHFTCAQMQYIYIYPHTHTHTHVDDDNNDDHHELSLLVLFYVFFLKLRELL